MRNAPFEVLAALLASLILACGDARVVRRDDAGRGDDAGGEPTPNGALVALLQHEGEAGALSGMFFDRPLDHLLRGEIPGCTTIMESGACHAVQCSSGPALTSANAGTLRASVRGVEIATASLGESTYFATQTSPIFAPGDLIEISAGGDVVPAFRASVLAPEALLSSIPSTISRANDLTLTWSPAIAAAHVQVSLLPSTGSVLVTCRLPTASGMVTVARSLLAQLPNDDSTSVTVFTENATRVRAGTYDVHVSAKQFMGTHAVVTD